MNSVLPSPDDESDHKPGSWLARVVPDALAIRALSVEVRGPAQVTVGDPESFAVIVKNRLPATISIALPSSRSWGWQVDGLPEADERAFEPPDAPQRVVFGRREQRVFEATWDGRVRQRGPDGDRWAPRLGTVVFTGYFAVESWKERDTWDSLSVEVTSP